MPDQDGSVDESIAESVPLGRASRGSRWRVLLPAGVALGGFVAFGAAALGPQVRSYVRSPRVTASPSAERVSSVSPRQGARADAAASPTEPAETAVSALAIDPSPMSPGASRVLGVLGHVRDTMRMSSYRHDLRVDERAGIYQWDCSLMASWVLSRAAPRARAGMRSGGSRPLAVDYVRTIRAAPAVTSQTRPSRAAAWGRVPRVSDARPGDVLAWQRPRWFRSNNTGHVAFVIAPPEPYVDNTVLVRIADASSYNHENDTRAGGTGYGEGTLLVAVDPTTGAGTGYGWFGRAAISWIIPTEVVIGRPMR